MILAASLLLALQQDGPHLEILSVSADKTEVRRGETFNLAFRLRILPGWRIYSVSDPVPQVRPRWTLDPDLEPAGSPTEPPPRRHVKQDEWDRDYGYHEGTVELLLPVRFRNTAAEGPASASGLFEYQICSDQCLDEKSVFSVPVRLLDESIEPSIVAETGAADAASDEFERKGWLWLLGLAIAGGLISLVQPCVYPLIPITITSFARQSAGGRPFLFGGCYALGIVATFTTVGFGLSLAMGPAGAQIFASNPWVNLTIAAIFFALALSMFGLFELRLFSSWTGGAPRNGAAGAFLLGLLFAVVSFTCTIPWAATILGISASSGHRFAGLAAMLAYSATMAVPFALLGFFPALLSRLPKGGPWLKTVKVTGGFLELGIGLAYLWKPDHVWRLYFLRRDLVLWLWVALCAAAILYLLASARPRPGIGRSLASLGFAALGSWLFCGHSWDADLGPMNTVLPPIRSAAVHESFPEALEEARRTGKPIFVEFTGVT